nr:MAG TPA: hypothetical protein [Caudoviricetes sp.]
MHHFLSNYVAIILMHFQLHQTYTPLRIYVVVYLNVTLRLNVKQCMFQDFLVLSL